MTYIWVGIGGMAGSALRYLIGLALAGASFPAGTLIANLAGCFLLGMLTEWLEKSAVSEKLYKALTTGVIGSFTTFSAFSTEVASLANEGRMLTALLYFSGSAAAGLLFTAAGFAAGRKLGKKEVAN